VHLIVALLKEGHRVASIDTDSRQLSLTRYIENRTAFAKRTGHALETPAHFSVRLGEGKVLAEVEAREFAAFTEIVDRLGERYDFVVIDTPASDSYRMRLSHALADTLVTPVNDSFVDLDVLGRIEGCDLTIRGPSQYAALVRTVIDNRVATGLQAPHWVVVRNRIASIASRNQRRVLAGLHELAAMLGFRAADGISERLVFRELFPSGLTVFDTLERNVLGVQPTMSHLGARREIRELLDALALPGRYARQAVAAPGGGRIASPIAAAAQ
jgi:chromosome partitioning protein